MLIMQLVEQGKLKLDVPISTWLPDYSKKNGDVITIHHLLTHSSGIPNMTSFPGFVKDVMRNSYSPAQLVNMSADSTLQFKPGERFAYSNSGYLLLGYIIEKVTGKSYEQVLQENIFTPLKMNNTGYDHHGTLLKNRASGYEKNGRRYGIKILKDNGIKTDDLIKKVPIEYLKLLEGEYLNVDNKEWKIKFDVTEGILYGNDRGYRYKILPVGDSEFVNPDNGASLVFDTKNKNAITMVLFGRFKFKKVL
jgi:CubicO group peptidase (beta-lactamase class C family)